MRLPGEMPQEAESRRALTRAMWRGRLKGVQRNVEVWQALLSVRSLVLPRHQDTHTWLKFCALARKSGRTRCGTPPPECVQRGGSHAFCASVMTGAVMNKLLTLRSLC